ncbi:MAG: hypothetical protein OPY05_01000 [Nitrosopumilus sp.]|nr:hypothetical protein [Nitrosopumilus sp.]
MRTVFSREQIAKFLQHPCVFACTKRSIHYTFEFKKRALELYFKGISPDEIWKQAGFDVNIWKKHYCGYTIKDWRRIVMKGGIESLAKRGGMQSDPGSKDSADKMRRLELQVKYLEAENDFLAQLRAKRAESNSGRVRNTRLSGK